MNNSKTLQEVIKYLSYSIEMVEQVRKREKRATSTSTVFTDLSKGESALAVALEYFKIAEEEIREQDKIKQNEENEERV